MENTIQIENIEEMRRQEAIDDTDLRLQIRSLKVGDFVKLTFLTGATSFETALVRITKVDGSAFRGKLADRPSAASLRKLAGVSIAFSSDHIHSTLKRKEVET